MTLKNNRAPLLCYFKLCASFCSHWWIQTGVIVRKTPNLGQIRRFLEPCDLEIWRMTLKNNRAPLLSNIKLYASFHHHMWIQTGVTVRKRLSWVVTSVTLPFCMDLPRWAEVRSGAWRCAPPSTSYMQNAPLCTPAHLQSYPDSGVQGGAHLPAPPGLSHLLIAFISNCMAEVLLGCAPPSTSRT